eukprot:TRINITY_DN78815_c0_g1_i1.p1 TRINITY_DN78815_c0_g1~~TRINITY_DN78815_c0_g1_i1.p1  ORF type:complete len:190 (-),score=30.38 TRINITY_DN78815_c0_g1_i1:186-674(-)
MSAKQVARAFRSIDWDKLAKVVVSEEGKREMAALRRAHDEVSGILDTKFNQKLVDIDWSFYRSKLNPKIVDMFEKSYKDVQIPEYVDTLTPEFEKEHQKLVAQAAEEEEHSKVEAARLKGEIEKIRAQKDALKSMTVDEYLSKNPALKQKIDEEIRNQNWGY